MYHEDFQDLLSFDDIPWEIDNYGDNSPWHVDHLDDDGEFFFKFKVELILRSSWKALIY